jgi:iron complex outermembrane receptor protein
LYDIGAYGFIKWKHNDFTISGGVRYDKRYIISPDFYVLPNPDNGFMGQASNADVDATLQFPSLHQTFHGMSLSIGTTYSVSQSVSLKANIARGYRAPNISEIASNGLDPGAHIVYLGNRNFVPEFSFQQDLGVYADFSNVVASVSVFNNFLQHYIFLSQVTDEQGEPVELVQGNKTFQYKQASARLYGAEASFDFRPKTIKGFNLAANMSAVYGNNTSKNFDGKGTEGQYLPFIPPLKILSSVSQNFNLRSHIVPSVNIKMEIDFNASQNRYMALYHTETRTSSYSLFNASCNFDVNYIKKARMQIQFQINNVFNIVYQSNLSRLKYFEYYNQSPNGMLGMYGMGRNVCVKVNFPF